jgi:hypothetical protein
MLFDKSTNELREAFIRNMFAEPNRFNNPDIEDWLSKQRAAIQPDDQGWNHCLGCIDAFMFACSDNPIGYLRKYGNQDFAIRESIDQQTDASWEKLQFLLDTTRSGGLAQAYYATLHYAILVDQRTSQPYCFDLSADGKTATVSFESPSPVVMDAIYATWQLRGPNYLAAREFLCDKLGKEIAKMRRESEAEFDKALAVSADGKKLTSASMVVIVPDDGAGILYRNPSIFRSQKMKRPCGRLSRLERGFDEDDLIDLIEHHRKQGCREIWWAKEVTIPGRIPKKRECVRRTILVVPISCCELPLPDGGEKVFGW